LNAARRKKNVTFSAKTSKERT